MHLCSSRISTCHGRAAAAAAVCWGVGLAPGMPGGQPPQPLDTSGWDYHLASCGGAGQGSQQGMATDADKLD